MCDHPDCKNVVIADKQYASFWGQYLYRQTWGSITTATLEAGYEDGTYDCTWYCVPCHKKIENSNESEKAIARRLGLYDNEAHRQAQWSKRKL